jgi:hypothetical protein
MERGFHLAACLSLIGAAPEKNENRPRGNEE